MCIRDSLDSLPYPAETRRFVASRQDDVLFPSMRIRSLTKPCALSLTKQCVFHTKLVYASRSPPRRTSNVRFRFEHGSDRHETSAKCVSDDLQFLIFSRRKKKFEKKSDIFFGFSLFSTDFGGARDFLMPKSDSSRYFASDGQIFRSVGRLEWSEANICLLYTSPSPRD